MARFYAHYTNATESGLEVINASNAYQKRTMDTTAAATARTNMLNARAAASSSFYSSIDVANRNGNSGVVVPSDAYTDNGTTISGANLYTNTASGTSAVWPSDPRVRPTAQITIANSTVISPADNFSVASTDIYDGRQGFTDYMTAVTGGSPYTRLGLNPWRTLASVWHDHAFTYFAWDDFTPGQLQSFNVTLISGVGEPEELRFTGNYQYANDENPDARIELIASLVGPSTYNLNTLIAPTSGSFTYDWLPNGVASVTAGSYTLTVTARVRDPVIITHFGTQASDTDSYNFPI
jgi:hypothetical protein